MSTVKILIADPHEFVRRGLISILAQTHANWRVVVEVAAGTAALETGTTLRPDIAILELSMPGLGGLQVAEQLLQSVPGIRTVILSMYAAAPILRQVRKAGVNAYLSKNENPRAIVQALERVLAGEPFFASDQTSLPLVEASEHIPVQFLLKRREIDVLRLLVQGKTNKELAAELDISVRTAESLHANLRAKINVRSLADLLLCAIRDGVS